MSRREEHDRYCPQARMFRDDAVEWWDGCQTDFDCRCDLIAHIRRDISDGIASLKPVPCPDPQGSECIVCQELDQAVGIALDGAP